MSSATCIWKRLMLASVSLLPVASGTDAATISVSDQAPAWRLTAIDLSVDVNYKEERLAGTARLEIENVSAQPASTLSLLLGRLMHVDRVGSPQAASIRFEQRVAVFPIRCASKSTRRWCSFPSASRRVAGSN